MSKLKKMLCRIFRHTFKETRKISQLITEVKCEVCGKEFGYHSAYGRYSPLTPDLKAFHDSMLGTIKDIDEAGLNPKNNV